MASQQDARDKGLAFINTAKDKSLGFFSRRSMIDKLGLVCVAITVLSLIPAGLLALLGLLINGLGGFVDTLATVCGFLNLTAIACFSLGGPRRRKVMGIVFIVIVSIVGAIMGAIFVILRAIGAMINALRDSKGGDSRSRDRSSTSDDDEGREGAQHLWAEDQERQATARQARRQRPGGRRR